MTRPFYRILLALLTLALLTAPLVIQAQENQTTHTVQSGETLYRIALQYGVTMAEIAQVNNIVDYSRIYRGQVLVIPTTGSVLPPAPSESVPTAAHTVQRGETLAAIARRYGMSLSQIMQINAITNANWIYAGQQLTVWGSTATDNGSVSTPAPAPAPSVESTYIVQRGETLGSIALRFGISWPTLAAANNITDPNRVYTGQVLRIPGVDLTQGQGETPNPTITVGKQIIVDMSNSTIYAYQDGQLIREVLVSLGRAQTPTVQGDFTIYRRVRVQTMTGPGYSTPNVEWVQYFYQGYALHGAWWHSNWGQPMSHGCVNMPNAEAEWFWNFGEIGTPVRVQW